MPQMNLFSPITNDKTTPLAVRQRMLMAEALQDQAANRTVTPAGKRGIAVGMAQLAAGLMSGVAERQAVAQQEAGQRASQSRFGQFVDAYGKAQPGASASPFGAAGLPHPVAAAGNLPTMARGPLSADDRDLLIRTVAGEAGGESPDGQAGVASVIRNRMASGNFGGSTVRGVVLAPKQFSLWNPGDKAGDLARNLDPNSPQYQRIGSIVDGVFGGSIADPTNGADHYYNPHVASPGWGDALAARNDVKIGNHRFVGGDPGLSRMPATPAGQLAATPGSTLTPKAMPNGDPGMMADLPAANAQPVSGNGLPGDMMPDAGQSPAATAAANAMPGNDDAVRTSPTTPTAIDPQQQALAAALMQSDPGTPALTPANPDGAPAAMLQPSDILNTMPGQGGQDGPAPGLGMAMNAPQPNIVPARAGLQQGLGVAEAQKQGDPSMMSAPSPYGAIPPGTGDPDAQSLAAALQNFRPTMTPQGTLTPNSGAPLPDQAQPSFQAGTTVGQLPPSVRDVSNNVADMQAAGLPSFGGLPETNGKRVALSNSPDFSAAPSPAGAPVAPASMMAANVPLPPVRPDQATLDSLGAPQQPAGQAAFTATKDPIAAASHAVGQPDMPAPAAQPAMAQGLPASMMTSGPGQGFSGVGKQATETSPTAFNLQQAGDGNAGLVAALQSYQPGQGSASSMSVGQRSALASALQNGGGASPMSSVMGGGDIGAVAAQQFDRLGGNTDGGLSGSDRAALANGLNPGVVPAPAGAPPAASGADWRQQAAAVMSDPYATPAMQSYAAKLLEGQKPPEAYTLHAGEQRFDGNNRLVASVPASQQDRYEYRDVGGRLVAVNKADPTDVRDATPAGLPSGYRPATPQERQAYGVQDSAPLVIGPDGKPQSLGGGTNVTVNNAVNPILKGLGDQFVSGAEEARAAADTVRSIQTARAQLTAPGGIVSGQFANPQLALQKAGAALGIGDTSTITNTETFRAAVKPIVLSTVKGLGAGSGISNADRDFAERAVGGSITLDASSIGRIMDITERAARSKIDRQNALADQMLKTQPDLAAVAPMLRIEAPPEMPAVDAGAQAPAAAAPAVAPRVVGGDAITGNPLPMPQAQQQAAQQATPADALNQARAAIAAGKSRSAVIGRLRSLNIDPTGL